MRSPAVGTLTGTVIEVGACLPRRAVEMAACSHLGAASRSGSANATPSGPVVAIAVWVPPPAIWNVTDARHWRGTTFVVGIRHKAGRWAAFVRRQLRLPGVQTSSVWSRDHVHSEGGLRSDRQSLWLRPTIVTWWMPVGASAAGMMAA